jgi:hypothetical protein
MGSNARRGRASEALVASAPPSLETRWRRRSSSGVRGGEICGLNARAPLVALVSGGWRVEARLMGKAAENEAIKLRAAWFNNASVGLTLTGVIVPIFSAFRWENLDLFKDWTEGRFHPTYQDGGRFIVVLAVLSLGFYYASLCRVEAKKEIAKLQD